MSLRDKIELATGRAPAGDAILQRFGVLDNPFPAASQTSNNPHFPSKADELIDTKIAAFLRGEQKSQVLVVEGTQGVGKTNVLNHYERELADILPDMDGYYVIRYMADPESSFDGTLRRLFQELGTPHLKRLATALANKRDAIEHARGHDMRKALQALVRDGGQDETVEIMLDWLTGGRLLNRHRNAIHVQFRLDTVESKTAALRDLVFVSSDVGILNGIFLLLDELEKQDGVLSPALVVRYLSSMRALVDALPQHLFMMIAVTPDALRRYSNALPAFRSRLEDRVELTPLTEWSEARSLADFYVRSARDKAKGRLDKKEFEPIVRDDEVRDIFDRLLEQARKRGDTGLRQREFLHNLNQRAEQVLQGG